jgi:hypothetical protein
MNVYRVCPQRWGSDVGHVTGLVAGAGGAGTVDSGEFEPSDVVTELAVRDEVPALIDEREDDGFDYSMACGTIGCSVLDGHGELLVKGSLDGTQDMRLRDDLRVRRRFHNPHTVGQDLGAGALSRVEGIVNFAGCSCGVKTEWASGR